MLTSHSAYVATSTESHGVKIDGFLISKFYVDSENVSKKFLHYHSSVKGDFSLLRSEGGGTFFYIFGIHIKFGCKNPSVLTPCDSVDVAT